MSKKIILNEKWLRKQYIDNELTLSEVAILAECSIPTLTKNLKHYNISIRTFVTENTKNKMSENHADVSGENNPIYGKPRSEETRRRISNANSDPSEETRGKMSQSREKFVGENHPNFGKHWTLSKEAREHMSIAHKGKCTGPDNPMFGRVGKLNPFFGKHHTAESKEKISIANTNPSEEKRRKMSIAPKPSGKDHYLYGKSPSPYSGFGKGCYFTKSDGITVWLRSSYELAFATALKNKNIKWEYEKRFELIDDVWHPDFYLSGYDLYIEVKGWLTENAKRKMIKFKNEYPNIKLRILEKKDIDLFLDTDISITDVGVLLRDYLQHLNLT